MNNALLRRIAHGALRLANLLVDGVVLSAFILVLLFCTYAILDNNSISSEADTKQFETYKPAEKEEGFEELRALNSEVVGWLNLYGTGVDYPLVQASDNEKYLNTNAKGEFALSGSLFLDARSASDFSGQTTIIFGHHMEHSLMFGDLDKYAEQNFFEQHPYGDLYFAGAHHGVEIAAYLLVDAYDEIVYSTHVGQNPTRETFDAYVAAHAKHLRASALAPNKHLLVLSTCSAGTNERHVVIASFSDTTYVDEFAEQQETKTLSHTISEGLATWLKIALGLIVFIVLAWILGSPRTQKKKGKESSHHEVQ